MNSAKEQDAQQLSQICYADKTAGSLHEGWVLDILIIYWWGCKTENVKSVDVLQLSSLLSTKHWQIFPW